MFVICRDGLSVKEGHHAGSNHFMLTRQGVEQLNLRPFDRKFDQLTVMPRRHFCKKGCASATIPKIGELL